MQIETWNIRRLNKGLKQKKVVDLFQTQELAVLGIMETKLTEQGFQSMKHKRFQQLELEHYSKGMSKS